MLVLIELISLFGGVVGSGRDRMLLCLDFLIIDSLGRCTFFPRCLAIIAFSSFPFSFFSLES